MNLQHCSTDEGGQKSLKIQNRKQIGLQKPRKCLSPIATMEVVHSLLVSVVYMCIYVDC